VLGTGDYGYADYGLVLRNRSLARDAIDITVEVEAVDGPWRAAHGQLHDRHADYPPGGDFRHQRRADLERLA